MYAIAGKRLLLSCADVPQLTGQGFAPYMILIPANFPDPGKYSIL
ncbi:hypothetical protein [Leuconostoc mesenteroides]|nr:hypothetical protein [Leuconostoc mesenteroides]